MDTFEALPACDVIGVGEFLGVELRILQKPESPKLQAQLDEKEAWKGMIASIFAQGIVVKDISTIEVENVLSTRDQLEGLRSLAPVVLRRKDSRLVISPITASWGVGGIADFVSGEELCNFTCRSSPRRRKSSSPDWRRVASKTATKSGNSTILVSLSLSENSWMVLLPTVMSFVGRASLIKQ